MIKQEKTLLTADTPWGEIKPLIGYVLSERERERERESTKYRKHQISAGFFALYLYYFSFAYCKDMKNNPKELLVSDKTLFETLIFLYV